MNSLVAAGPASAEPLVGARSPSSSTSVAAAPASTGPPGGARWQSSSTRVAAAPASAEHSAPAVFPVACLGGVSSRPDGWAHPGGRRRKMCCGAAWPAWSAGGPHRITKCNANGWERVTARNYISKQSTMVQNSVQWARWPGPAQRRGRGVTAADRRSTAGSVIRIEHRSSGSLRPSASVH